MKKQYSINVLNYNGGNPEWEEYLAVNHWFDKDIGFLIMECYDGSLVHISLEQILKMEVI